MEISLTNTLQISSLAWFLHTWSTTLLHRHTIFRPTAKPHAVGNWVHCQPLGETRPSISTMDCNAPDIEVIVRLGR